MTIYEWNEDTQALECRVDSFPYRSKWACFECRKSFVRTRQDLAEAVKCPDCGVPASDMGYLFEPPKKRDARAWEIMAVLSSSGFRFHRAGSKVFIDRFLTEGGKLKPREVRERIVELIRNPRPF